MKTNTIIYVSRTHLATFWVSSYGPPKGCQPSKLQDSLKCNIVRKSWKMKFNFCMQINIEVFCEVILSFWVSVTGFWFPTVLILPGQSRFWYAVLVSQIESVCSGFYISYQINVHIHIIFHKQCKTIHL